MKKVVIGIPSGVMVHTDFAMALAALVTISTMQGFQISLVNKQRTRIELNRYGIVMVAQKMGADAILFLDTDMVFPADTLLRLWDARKSIIACNASKRVENQAHISTAELYPALPERGVTKVKRIGTGIMLIKTEVFNSLKPPYFKAVWTEGKFMGEDLYFCDKAKEAGYSINCDHDLSREISHIGVKHYKLEG